MYLKDIKTKENYRKKDLASFHYRKGKGSLTKSILGNEGDAERSENVYAAERTVEVLKKTGKQIGKTAKKGIRVAGRAIAGRISDEKSNTDRKDIRKANGIKDKALVNVEKSQNEINNNVLKGTALVTAGTIGKVAKWLKRIGSTVFLAGGSGIMVFMIIVLSVLTYLFSGFSYSRNGTDINALMSEAGNRYRQELEDIKGSIEHDSVEITEDIYSWHEILSLYQIYSVKSSDDVTDEMESFWGLYRSTYTIVSETEEAIVVSEIEHVDHDGNTETVTVEEKKIVLHIDVRKKDIETVFQELGFTAEDRELYYMYLENDSAQLMSLFGSGVGNSSIVEIARREIGYTGGEKYWRAYGFTRHAAWCACFVTWCANEAGLIEEGKVPRYALCLNGVKWFKNKGKWLDKGIVPETGMIIFYDRRAGNGYGQDGRSDHTGIVEKVEGNYVYTIEGNWGDKVDTRKVRLDDKTILGYGYYKKDIQQRND